MKKLLFICIIFAITLSQLTCVNIAYAANYTVEEVADLILYDIDDEAEEIRRIDALVAIMNAIGMSNYDSVMYPSPCFGGIYTWADFLDIEAEERLFWRGYLRVAHSCSILYGEETPLDNGTIAVEYDLLSNATSGACVAFMMRAMSDENQVDMTNTDILYDMAKSSGLLKEEDVFYNDASRNISVAEFRELLIRFLEQSRYKYWNEVGIERDKERSCTYLNYLNENESSWLNKAPEIEDRVVLVNNRGASELIDIKGYLTDSVTYFPCFLMLVTLNEQTGGSERWNDDGSYTVENGMGDVATIYPGSDILIKNGEEYKLSSPTLDKNRYNFGITEEVLQLIYNDKVDISYYANKMYYCITVNLIL